MSKMTKEFAEKYIKEELDSRLKHLVGQPDALCQAYQTALDAMAPKKKCYIFTVETRAAQAYLEPAWVYLEPTCIPPSDEDEWEDEDVEELDEEDIWSDVSGSIIYDRIYADSKEEAVQAFIKNARSMILTALALKHISHRMTTTHTAKIKLRLSFLKKKWSIV